MATIVSFHAHPDDESIGTGGTLARAADAGHRVVLVFATRGELGEPVQDVLVDGEQLSMRRTAEVYESARVLGVDRVEFLGYTDSGMIGEATNDAPWCFWQADVGQAARRLAAILGEEEPDVLAVYDDNGGYGHPDHIQVHRVGLRAAEMAGVATVVQGTINRDHIARAIARASEFGLEVPDGVRADLTDPTDGAVAAPAGPAGPVQNGPPDLDEHPDFGKPEAELTHLVDVTGVLGRKRDSMRAHASQIAPEHFMVAMPDEAFAYAFGTEWYIVAHLPDGDAPALFDELFQPKPA